MKAPLPLLIVAGLFLGFWLFKIFFRVFCEHENLR